MHAPLVSKHWHSLLNQEIKSGLFDKQGTLLLLCMHLLLSVVSYVSRDMHRAKCALPVRCFWCSFCPDRDLEAPAEFLTSASNLQPLSQSFRPSLAEPPTLVGGALSC